MSERPSHSYLLDEEPHRVGDQVSCPTGRDSGGSSPARSFSRIGRGGADRQSAGHREQPEGSPQNAQGESEDRWWQSPGLGLPPSCRCSLAERHPELNCPTWGKGNSAQRKVRDAERELERAVSRYIRKMPFLWVEADDAPSKDSLRAHIERNAIALLSGWGTGSRQAVDPPSGTWLGRHCPVGKVRDAGLWNSRSVDGQYEHGFLRALQGVVRMM